jgi:hypothetical protein
VELAAEDTDLGCTTQYNAEKDWQADFHGSFKKNQH